MKCLSVRNPWPYAIFHLGKDVENRDWPTSYKGPLLIHASKTWNQEGYEWLTLAKGEHVPSKDHHVYGAIVGVCDLVDCVDDYGSIWFYGNYGFILENAKEFRKPIPYRGQLGIFDVPDEVVADAMRGWM